MNRHHLLLLYRSIKNLGFFEGTNFWLTSTKKQQETKFRINGLPNEIIARTGTTDIKLVEKIFFQNEYPALAELRPSTIIDAGANVGYTSLYYHRLFPMADIICVEPESANFEILSRNVSGYPKIHPLQAAVWSKRISLRLSNPQDESYSFRVAADLQHASNISGLTITDIIQKNHWRTVDLLKVDIEGAEKEIFTEGSYEWLPLVKCLVIELHERYAPGCGRALFSALSPFNYEVRIKGESLIINFH